MRVLGTAGFWRDVSVSLCTNTDCDDDSVLEITPGFTMPETQAAGTSFKVPLITGKKLTVIKAVK